MSRAGLLWLLVFAGPGCTCARGDRSTDTWSKDLAGPAHRLAFLKDYAQGPTEPLDAEFHLVFHDNSQGLLAGPSDYAFDVALKVRPDDVSRWAEGCTPARLDPKPAWAAALLADKAGWAVATLPDTLRCGSEERLLFVKEAIIFRHASSR